MNERPPLGPKPKWLWLEERLKHLTECAGHALFNQDSPDLKLISEILDESKWCIEEMRKTKKEREIKNAMQYM